MCLVFRVSIFGLVVGKGKVVDTIPVPVGMYRIGTYISINLLLFNFRLYLSVIKVCEISANVCKNIFKDKIN